jgi:uncharacterized protein
MKSTKEKIEEINQLFVEGTMERFMDCLSDNVIWEMYTSSGNMVMNGKSEVEKMDGSNMPEHTSFEFSTVVVEGDVASVQGKSTGKRRDGTEYVGYFCDVYHFEGDKVAKIVSYVIDNKNESAGLTGLA